MPRAFVAAAKTSLDAFAVEFSESLRASRRDKPDIPAEFWSDKPMEHTAHAGHLLLELVGASPSPALQAISAGANAWKSERQQSYRVNSTGSARQRFAVEMTRYFRDFYGSPLREACAAILRVLFDGEIDASAVAHLAP